MTALINIDTMKKTHLTHTERDRLRQAFARGEIHDDAGNVIDWEEVEDRDGDLIVEDYNYQTCIQIAQG